MRLIDPKMSIDTIKSYIVVWDCKGCLPYGGTQHNVMAVDDLEYLPTIEAEPVRHGRWIPTEYDAYADGVPVWDKWECSECGHEHKGEEGTLTAFCPDCGAYMKEVGANNG